MNKPLNYKDAGVDIDAGNRLVETIKNHTATRPEVLAGIGGFNALFELPPGRYQHPVLVSATDGVGTKLKLAFQLQQHATIGIDLVAMCANDIITCGAEPLFFLDYYATGRLDVATAANVIQGIAQGCHIAGMALVGGETAEMPGMYHPKEYDLAGFCVGVCEKTKLITGKNVQPSDVLIGIASTGPHSNGYSLIRHILSERQCDLQQTFADSSLGEVLLAPTRIYVPALLALQKAIPVKAIAHITGGGLIENIPRVLPSHMQAQIDLSTWSRPPIFQWLQTEGQISDNEMWRTFNCGIGMVVCVTAENADKTLQILHEQGEKAWHIGHIAERSPQQPAVVLK